MMLIEEVYEGDGHHGLIHDMKEELELIAITTAGMLITGMLIILGM